MTLFVEVPSASHSVAAHADTLVWMHKADDPRCYVGDVVEATETDDGLAIKGRFDLDTEFGKSALPGGALLRRRLKGLVDDGHQFPHASASGSVATGSD